MLPVEPNIAIFFMLFPDLYILYIRHVIARYEATPDLQIRSI